MVCYMWIFAELLNGTPENCISYVMTLHGITFLFPLFLTYEYLKPCYPDHVPSFESVKKLALVIATVSAFVGSVNLSTGVYMALSKNWQPVIVLVIGGYRAISGLLIEYIGLSSGAKVSIKTVIMFGSVIDLVYEVYSGTLLTGAKSGLSLVLPAVMDLGGNIGLMCYIWIFPVSQGTQFVFLVTLALREMVELVASAGVMGIICSIWYFNKTDYFMIDVVSDEGLLNAALMSVSDFFLELFVFIIFERMVYKVWKVSLSDLGQAYIRSIGKAETFCFICGWVFYVMMFMNYHYGCDYFMNFEWMNEENLAIAALNDGTPTWCDIMQSEGVSCYNYDYTPRNLNATMIVNATMNVINATLCGNATVED